MLRCQTALLFTLLFFFVFGAVPGAAFATSPQCFGVPTAEGGVHRGLIDRSAESGRFLIEVEEPGLLVLSAAVAGDLGPSPVIGLESEACWPQPRLAAPAYVVATHIGELVAWIEEPGSYLATVEPWDPLLSPVSYRAAYRFLPVPRSDSEPRALALGSGGGTEEEEEEEEIEEVEEEVINLWTPQTPSSPVRGLGAGASTSAASGTGGTEEEEEEIEEVEEEVINRWGWPLPAVPEALSARLRAVGGSAGQTWLARACRESPARADDHGDSPLCASRMPVGATAFGNLSETDRDLDFFVFLLPRSSRIRVESAGAGERTVSLYDARGRRIAAGSGTAGSDLWFERRLGPGRYRLRVEGEAGSYSLHLLELSDER